MERREKEAETAMASRSGPIVAPPARSGAVSSGYKFASTWEQNAPLTEQQQAAITALAHAAAERPMPSSHVGGLTTAAAAAARRQDQEAMTTSPSSREAHEEAAAMATDLVELTSQHQFYKWFADLETAMKSEHSIKLLPRRQRCCTTLVRGW